MDTENLRAAKVAAAKILGRQMLPSQMLAEKLRRKGFSSDVIETTIASFVSQGYLNDKEWAEAYIAHSKRRGYGAQRTRQHLLSNGIGEEIINEVLNEDDEDQQIDHLLNTRYRSRNLRDPKERRRTAASLMRRGFSNQGIYQALFSEGGYE